MLIEYTIENFRSIADPVTVTMIPARGSSKPGNFIQVTKNSNFKKLLRSSVIYGANASGKTNVIFGLKTLCDLVVNSKNLNAGDKLFYAPFVLDKKHSNKPTKFSIHFIKDDTEYRYAFSYNSDEILSEELSYLDGKKEVRFFKRAKKFEPLIDEEELTNLFRSTGKNVLFLSKANNEYKRFRSIFEWFNSNLLFVGTSMDPPIFPPLSSIFTVTYMNKSDNHKQKLMNLIHFADFDIFNVEGKNITISSSESFNRFKDFVTSLVTDVSKSDLKIEQKKVDPKLMINGISNAPTQPILFSNLQSIRKRVDDGSLIHKDFVTFESSGTKQFFNLAGLWLDALQEENKILVIDEFDLKLHPHLQQYLIELFHNPDINIKNSQLIITTHNTKLLSLDLFRREQIQITNKNPHSKSTELNSLYDFEKRQDREIERNYLFGRYGGLPDITHGKI